LMPKGATSLQDAINESLKKHMENGDFKTIFEKYVGIDLTPAS